MRGWAPARERMAPERATGQEPGVPSLVMGPAWGPPLREQGPELGRRTEPWQMRRQKRARQQPEQVRRMGARSGQMRERGRRLLGLAREPVWGPLLG